MAMNFPSQGGSNIGISFSRLTGVPFVLNARLNALETTGRRADPLLARIMTLDNKTARIKQGVEFPYLERDSAGGSSVKFKNIDLLLEVTPQVTPDNRIAMTISSPRTMWPASPRACPRWPPTKRKPSCWSTTATPSSSAASSKASKPPARTVSPGLAASPCWAGCSRTPPGQQQNNELLIFITPRIVQLEQAVAQSMVQYVSNRTRVNNEIEDKVEASMRRAS
jgi:type IV pilus assembly protein PilQ